MGASAYLSQLFIEAQRFALINYQRPTSPF